MQKATKISEDTVRLETEYYTKTGKPVTISQQEFKRDHIEERIQAFTEKIDIINAPDYIAKQLEEPLREKARYAKLKAAVDGDVGGAVVVEPDE